MNKEVKVASNRRLTLLSQAGGFLTILALLNAPLRVAAIDVTLAWDPSPESSVAGYRLYYGTASRQYVAVIDVQSQTNGTVPGLQEGSVYYFAVTAYTTNQVESDFSAEAIRNTVPMLSEMPDQVVARGERAGTVGFTVSDAETPADHLIVTATSSNPALIPNNNILPGGSGRDRTITFPSPIPAAVNPGTARITVSVSDGLATATRAFSVVVCDPSQMPRSPLTVQIAGLGTVMPNRSGSELVVGATYTVRAVPGADKNFVGWSGDCVSACPELTFVMQASMVLRATFAPHAYAGAYNGLFYEADEARPGRAGFFWARVSTNGLYSARLDLGGTNYPWTGQFGGRGRATRTLSRPGTNALSVVLQLDREGGTDQITGQVSDGTWVAGLLADRAISDAITDFGVYRGRYTLAIPGCTDPAAGPPGTGFGTLTVGPKGVVTMVGEVADGKPLTQTAALSKHGVWPLFSSLYGGKGMLLGWLTFTNRESDDLTGVLSWVKPTKPLAKFYPSGFTNQSVVAGCRYDTNDLTALNSAVVMMGGGNLSDVCTNAVTWVAGDSLQTTYSTGLPVGLDRATGVFSSTWVDPATSVSSTFRGVLLQKLARGAGYSRGTNEFGWVVIEPAL